MGAMWGPCLGALLWGHAWGAVMRHIGLIAIMALGLAACNLEVLPDVGAGRGVKMVDDCGADNLRALIGKPRSALNGVTLPASVRIISPGTPVTMDYSPTRLNIDLDEKGVIVDLRCG